MCYENGKTYIRKTWVLILLLHIQNAMKNENTRLEIYIIHVS